MVPSAAVVLVVLASAATAMEVEEATKEAEQGESLVFFFLFFKNTDHGCRFFRSSRVGPGVQIESRGLRRRWPGAVGRGREQCSVPKSMLQIYPPRLNFLFSDGLCRAFSKL